MHSMSLPSGGTAHFNGDFSGDIVFNLENDPDTEVLVPFEDIEKIVLEKFRRETLSELEQMDIPALRNLFGRAW